MIPNLGSMATWFFMALMAAVGFAVGRRLSGAVL